MVLSNKKLKQKIRAELAESLVASENLATNQTKDSNNDPPDYKSLNSLLISATQKPRLSKREKRRGGKSVDAQKDNEEDEDGLASEVVKRQKKRKRGDEEGDKITTDNGIEPKNLKSNKNKKKMKKKKKKAGGADVKKGVEDANGVGGQETVKATDNCQENAEFSSKVYVGGIPYYSTEDDICSFFESCGTITEVDCMKFPDTGKFRGIAIISFKTEAAAKRALALDGADMGGLFLKIQPCKTNTEKKVSDFSPAIVEGYNRIYVGNLSWDITEEDLRKFFSGCSISSMRFGEDKETKQFRGYAHVDFTDSLSVNMALKLDQEVVCGRPARIRCAVPTKKVAQSDTKSVPTSRTNANGLALNTDIGDGNTISGKIRRRTCYECGEKGHLTSSCPKKHAADSVKSLATSENADNIEVTRNNVEVVTGNAEVATISGKMKRRTCYECGEKGHLTSSCPNKQSADSTKSVPTSTNADTAGANPDNAVPSNVSGKIKRRTCYECGQKGHLTSSCPNKEAAVSVKPAPVVKNSDNVSSSSTVKVSSDNVESSTVSGKIKRRTCYECGEKGHLSSSCPKKQATDSVVLS